ncbi:MAG TPA: hypothetical protein VMW28_05870, partial [Pelolinea sp.]|nr:hypothetical protein [Pelolinea sp.]
MSQIIDRIKQSNIALIFTAVILFLFVSFSSHFTNLFFLPAEKRYLVIIGFLIADAIIFFLVWRFSNKRGFQKKIAELNLPLLLFPITLVAALVIAASGFIPSFRVPVDHRLEISFLPLEKGDSNKIDIHKIIRTINAPQEGGAEVEYDQLAIQGGFYEFTGDGIRLEENATLSFSSYYSGCVSILFNTSPESGQVLVR